MNIMNKKKMKYILVAVAMLMTFQLQAATQGFTLYAESTNEEDLSAEEGWVVTRQEFNLYGVNPNESDDNGIGNLSTPLSDKHICLFFVLATAGYALTLRKRKL
jgi:hypothetical protein